MTEEEVKHYYKIMYYLYDMRDDLFHLGFEVKEQNVNKDGYEALKNKIHIVIKELGELCEEDNCADCYAAGYETALKLFTAMGIKK